jgi:hypothetical protein
METSVSLVLADFVLNLWTCLPESIFFAPPNVPEDDELFDTKVLIRQLAFFGPFPEKYDEIASPVQPEVDALS